MNVRRDRGVALPSPLVALSIVAVVVAAVAFLVTGLKGSGTKDITPVVTASATHSASPTVSPTVVAPSPTPTKAAFDKSKISVAVLNASSVKGLAKTIAEKARAAGWNVIVVTNASSNQENTVYWPDGMEDAAKKLALDLGISRTHHADPPLHNDRLTVVLTGPVS